jgi:plastocyanin
MRSVFLFAGIFLLWGFCVEAATTNVNVENFDFSPASVTINVNDAVQWNWVSGTHSSTSSSGLWDSTQLGTPASYSIAFPAIGNYPYFCTVHGSATMSGSITVLSPGQSVSVTITNPANGAIYAAPWTGMLKATASDTGGTITKVEFFRNNASMGVVTSAPYNRNLTNLPAGNYTFTAVATDNFGVSNISPAVAVTVLSPSAIILSGPQRLSPTQFEFSYTADAGLRYVVERSGTLMNFTPILTNTAVGNSVGVIDNGAGAGPTFYRVGRLPNQ